MRAEREARRRCLAGGFSLLEVLAAVAILGILYMVLATVTIEGLRSEGQSDRRLRASLLADLRLAELEAPMEVGAPCPEPYGPDEIDEFEVEVEVVPLDIPQPQHEGDVANAPAGLSTLGIEQSPLCRIRVEVRWPEGAGERSVSRTTYGFDQTAWEALASSAGVGAGP